MSSKMSKFEQMIKLEMEETRDKSISGLGKRYDALKGLLIWVDNCSTMLSAFFLIECDKCGGKDHFDYQCDCNSNAILATYNSDDKCHASMEVLEFVIFTGASELLAFTRGIEEKGESINDIYDTVRSIYNCCLDYFGDNALIKEEAGAPRRRG